jgi:hypothetical protein
MSAIVIATKNGKCLPVLAASITMYLPDFFTVYLSGSGLILPKHRTITSDNTAGNFGDSYNNVVHQAIEDGHQDLLVCNDDIVFTPYTWQTLAEDLKRIPAEDRGWVATRSDYARGYQNIRFRHEGDRDGLRHASESAIVEVDVIAPICAWVESKNWVDFPPINWYSDDIQCIDMQKKGLKHYISRAYVHHVGSQTTGHKPMELTQASIPWIRENRPELAELWFKSN